MEVPVLPIAVALATTAVAGPPVIAAPPVTAAPPAAVTAPAAPPTTAASQVPCGTPAHLASPLPAPPRARLATGDKLVRDAYGVPNALETPNFVIRWGDEVPVDPADIEALGRNLEEVWRVEIVELGYPAPLTTGWAKLNVYVGDTGSGAPASGGAAGFYWYDDELFPMLVISSLSVDEPDLAAVVAGHELFHGVQAAAATYAFGEVDFWWWEATATWISSQIFPGNPHQASLLFGQAFAPEVSIDGYFYGSGGVLEFHAYGAFVFVTWLSEVGGDPDLIRRSWTEAPVGGDPIAVIEGLLADEGWPLPDAFFDFAVRNATWDYVDGPIYADSIAASGGWASPDSRRPSGIVDGATDWLEATADLPHTLGANYWQIDSLPQGAVLRFDGDPGPTWHVALAGRDGEEHVSVAVPLVDGTGDLALPAEALGWTDTWLVVAAYDGLHDGGPVGGYRFAVDGDEAGGPVDTARPVDTGSVDSGAPDVGPSDDGPEAPAGCGCSSAGSGGPWLLVALVALARRRPRLGADQSRMTASSM